MPFIFSETKAQDYLNPTLPIERRVDDLLRRMTLDEKIGQMMQIDLSVAEKTPEVITEYRVGSVLSGGDSDPRAGNDATSWRNASSMAQRYALMTPLKIPMVYGIDAVHGHSNVVGATIFPHNIGLGCTRDSSLIREAARVTAEEMAATGIRWDFGPMLGVPQNIRWGRTYEGFGETPALAQLGAVEVLGLQGDSLDGPASVLACAKHFLADGGTADGINMGNAEGDEAAIRKIHLAGYITALRYGVGSIMASYSSINGVKMHASKYWLTDVLKKGLGFRGFVVSDWAAVDLLGKNYEDDVQTSVNAGVDMVMLPQRYDDFRRVMRDLVQKNGISLARVDDAVRRILREKFALGLFEHPYPDSALISEVGSPEHRSVARRCMRESMVLLKNKNSILPLSKKAGRIIVAGSQADNLGFQCGGWTISWQGGTGNITVGTTILAGFKEVAPSIRFDYAENGDFPDTAAAYSIVVIGERPYAEGYGDRKDLSLSPNDVELVNKMKRYGHPVVVVIVSGRPLIIDKILDDADAIVAAWLPGTEGEGVADVLFGDYAPHGVLSFSWPKNMSQVGVHEGDPGYAPLFPVGFGITSYK
ncbi:MAG TPA: glycoside hydrolase family 3 N-terminal domain-containing protein [Bacteroidota bacterium]|nr:glycoside hydrolase family 3 N-terminal domain-containing protein [Bacteroidota bacterium]